MCVIYLMQNSERGGGEGVVCHVLGLLVVYRGVYGVGYGGVCVACGD